MFGLCEVGMEDTIQIPPAAFCEYGFHAGETVIILPGSRRSGGFSMGKQEKLANSGPLLRRALGSSEISAEGRIPVPRDAHLQVGNCFLAVRGSGYALMFITGGPIHAEARLHPEIEMFSAP